MMVDSSPARRGSDSLDPTGTLKWQALIAAALFGTVIFACGACAPSRNSDQTMTTELEMLKREAVQTVEAVESPVLKEALQALVPKHAQLLGDPEGHRLQILLSVPKQDSEGRWTLQRHDFRTDAEYFYPASTVKTAAAIAALKLMERSNASGAGWTLNSPLWLGSQFEEVEPQSRDETNLDSGKITVGHELRKLFLVSDNEAYNRFFEIVGRDGVNDTMHQLGLESFHLVHRLSEVRSADENRRFPVVRVLSSNGDSMAYGIPSRVEDLAGPNLREGESLEDLQVGKGFYANGELVEEPFDFSVKNRVSLEDLQRLNVLLFRPELLGAAEPRLHLSDEHRLAVHRAMRELPRASANPAYSPSEYPDDYVKFLLPGLRRFSENQEGDDGDRFVIYNKIGRAYGFTIENAYVVDSQSMMAGGVPLRSFFLNVVIYTNDNQTLNDDNYEYPLADAFLADLGEQVARVLWGATLWSVSRVPPA